MPELALALVPWLAVAAMRAHRIGVRQPRQRPRPMRDQITPEELEKHFDSLRRKRSEERKAFKS